VGAASDALASEAELSARPIPARRSSWQKGS